MSQKVHIINVKHSGSPVYIGLKSGNNSYTCNPQSIMEWLCNGYRTRFNQHRSTRCSYDAYGNLIPIGTTVIDIKDSQARQDYSFLSAIPSMIIQATERKENEEWFSAVKRKKTSGGHMPRFKSRKMWDMQFVCWSRGTTFHRTGKRTGVIIISGQNSQGKVAQKHASRRWKIIIRVKLSQDIREYTSILVNWTQRSVVFINSPAPIKHKNSDDTTSEKIIGCDRGGVIALATSDDMSYTYDKNKMSQWDGKRKFHQRKMSKARHRAYKSGGSESVSSVTRGTTYKHHKEQAAKYQRKISRYKKAWAQEVTTTIVKNNDTIVLENLNVSSMTSKGGARKRGLNRTFLSSIPSTIAHMLEYKCLLNNRRLVYIPAAYTSQRCYSCGYTHKENRESQAVFLCKKCNHTDNADSNAAKNIRGLYMFLIEGTDLPAYSSMNGSGEIIKPTIPKGMIDVFYRGSLDDAIDPSTYIGS